MSQIYRRYVHGDGCAGAGRTRRYPGGGAPRPRADAAGATRARFGRRRSSAGWRRRSRARGCHRRRPTRPRCFRPARRALRR
ncbi:hypothetical protein E3O06_11240 [Cryobacterium glaciale]|uniref:Uncharacterized protein n=1 Tax=Cryobacterium glaciale TaxID=1259145 RepID=A0A4R8UTU0_9MICO|nr:hypothetical protein E3O06_11240 [Cryobacterium glaciale]